MSANGTIHVLRRLCAGTSVSEMVFNQLSTICNAHALLPLRLGGGAPVLFSVRTYVYK